MYIPKSNISFSNHTKRTAKEKDKTKIERERAINLVGHRSLCHATLLAHLAI